MNEFYDIEELREKVKNGIHVLIDNYYLIYDYDGKVEVQEFDNIPSLESYINFMQITNYRIIKGEMIHETKED